ncbi:unnamed protein product [Pleuronectes platessa]|uniref:Uncharacterized protein n=1 Tax=Pleuronectes platessa TaxID=8262 RepID=A0A9N7ZAG0_PLEPL|nr:unnamed protein product [Pleuronectes platessa]
MERKDFRVSLEELDQRVTREIQVLPAPFTYIMEVMPEELKVNVVTEGHLESQVTWGTRGCEDLLANQEEPGLPGPQGHPGPKGYKGQPGGYNNFDINLLPGPKGTKGLPGPKGGRGLPGRPDYYCEPGVPGDPGDPGFKGSHGKKGHKGIKGSPGFPGAQGLIGDPGLKGDEGARGPCGFQGIPGFKGNKGPKGDSFVASGKGKLPLKVSMVTEDFLEILVLLEQQVGQDRMASLAPQETLDHKVLDIQDYLVPKVTLVLLDPKALRGPQDPKEIMVILAPQELVADQDLQVKLTIAVMKKRLDHLVQRVSQAPQEFQVSQEYMVSRELQDTLALKD